MVILAAMLSKIFEIMFEDLKFCGILRETGKNEVSIIRQISMFAKLRSVLWRWSKRCEKWQNSRMVKKYYWTRDTEQGARDEGQGVMGAQSMRKSAVWKYPRRRAEGRLWRQVLRKVCGQDIGWECWIAEGIFQRISTISWTSLRVTQEAQLRWKNGSRQRSRCSTRGWSTSLHVFGFWLCSHLTGVAVSAV